jgi:hypothetical protein
VPIINLKPHLEIYIVFRSYTFVPGKQKLMLKTCTQMFIAALFIIAPNSK